MLLKFTLKKFLSLSVISLLMTVVINYLGVVQAQSPVENFSLKKEAASHPLLVASSLAEFNLNPATAPTIPSNRQKSQKPYDNTRAVIDTDDRVLVTTNKYPWSTVGRVIGLTAEGNSYHCTGALIADNIVLTNAHCVIAPDSHLVSSAIAFEPNLIDGRLADENDRAYVTRYLTGTDFRLGNFPEPDDWAVLEIDRNLGSKYGTLNWEPLSTSELIQLVGDLVLVGYSGDFPLDNPGSTAGADLDCSIVGEVDGIFTHTCDMTEGSSGGPILGLIDDEVRIVGLNSAYTQNTETLDAINYAVKISRIVEQL